MAAPFKLGQLERRQRDLKNGAGRRFGEVDRRFGRSGVRLKSSTRRLTSYSGLFTGLITLVLAVSGLPSR